MLSSMLEPIKAALPDWPEWAMDVLLIMSGLLGLTGLVTAFHTPADEQSKSTATTNGETNTTHKDKQKAFGAFRRQYILVYLVIMLADWMQGTHMYTLYLSYGVNISALFLTGFLSGMIFAPFLGSLVDKYGRKRACIVYCVLEIVINTMEHSTDFTILLIGRVLGGISTNLLFSAFESWMTTEHRKLGFPEDWLTRTYSEASIGNGAMAIFAGIVAQVLEDNLGHIGPFQGAIALTTLALVLVLGWNENYGEESTSDQKEEESSASLRQQLVDGWTTTISDSRVWRIGMTQALSEGAMYTFVFMWVPTLLSQEPEGGVPTGCVFSSLMMAITMGGLLFPPLYSLFSAVSNTNASELSASFIYSVGCISMAVPALCLSGIIITDGDCFVRIVVSFLVMELCVGLFSPVQGTLRSKYVPDSQQGVILNIFRLPLNAIVVAGTYATDHMETSTVFFLVSGCLILASVLQLSMIFRSNATVTETAKKED